MPDVEFVNLLAVSVVALFATLALGLAPALRVPSVVLEIIAGVILGPQVLGWVEVDLPVGIVALLGLAFLLFLAGLEIDVHQLRGTLLRLALAGYVVTLAIGVAVGFGLTAAGWTSGPGLIAVTLSATSLGLVVPVLVATTAAAVSLVSSSKRLDMTLTRLQDTTAEIRVRAAVVILVAFVALAEQFGLESILGAFMAGAVVGLVDRDSVSHPNFRLKLEAIGYGFLIPVFFVSSGLRLDLSGLMENPGALVRVPVLLLALLL